MGPWQEVIQAHVVLGFGLKGPIMSTHFPTQTRLRPYVIMLLNEPHISGISLEGLQIISDR